MLNIFVRRIGKKFFELSTFIISLTFSTFFVEKLQTLFFLPRRHAKGREGNWHQTNLNKKFWEVQEPFFKRVPGRRRHRLTVNLGLKYGLTNLKKRVKVCSEVSNER